ncbi:hypothetical protein B0T16DRAFT_385046 [Cercophora newfieldiana]|uniref:Uncharacterized protein n=1 Tax=Cercophora newfieldiana TaxID=92897 RepID=A0AA39YPK7_9PEZI|nr:hypothetical protein B0T16DRAFT_385046 [Cercophora newfieldiana]
MDPLFRLKLDYITRIPMLTVEEFHTLSTTELEARPAALAIPVFGPQREITMCQGVRAFPDSSLIVQQFSPVEGDVVHKIWTNQQGEVKELPLLPFALSDPHSTSLQYRTLLTESWTEWARAGLEQYRLMAELYQSETGKKLLENFGPFALAYTLKMGSAWISSVDTLGMDPVMEEGYPLYGKVALPSIVKAQFDAMSSLVMTALQRGMEENLDVLEGISDWQVFFVAVAVMGHIVSQMRADRARHARQRGIEAMFTEPDSVEMTEKGMTEILRRFHRFQESFDVARLLESSHPGVGKLYVAVQEMDDAEEFSTGWWLRQATETDWQPRPTYQATL